jgi:hypothetical protein
VRRGLVAAALALVVGVVAGCGGGGSTSDLRATQERLGSIRAATLDLRLLVTPRISGGSRPFGYRLAGPFDLRSGGPLPRLRVRYVQIANGRTATATVVSDGHRATVSTGGKTVTLPPAAARQLDVLGGSFTSDSLDLAGWVRHPHVSSGPNGTERIEGELDVARALTYLAGLTGSPPPALTRDEQKRLQAAVQSSRIEVVTGEKDKLLRRVHLFADLGFRVPPDLRAALGNLVGARLELELALADARTA